METYSEIIYAKKGKTGHNWRSKNITKQRITIFEGPDDLGRHYYCIEWLDKHPPYCGVCGASPEENCGHYGPRMRGQMFHAPLPNNIKE